MKLQFTDERINEFKSGEFHTVNDGKAFEVSELLGHDLLNARHSLNGELVPVFKTVVKTDAGAEEITEETLKRKKKAELLDIAEQLQISDMTADKTNNEIIQKILEADPGNEPTEPVIDPHQAEINEAESEQ
jgi:hypothetical protein